jgi:hypothetical protein
MPQQTKRTQTNKKSKNEFFNEKSLLLFSSFVEQRAASTKKKIKHL